MESRAELEQDIASLEQRIAKREDLRNKNLRQFEVYRRNASTGLLAAAAIGFSGLIALPHFIAEGNMIPIVLDVLGVTFWLVNSVRNSERSREPERIVNCNGIRITIMQYALESKKKYLENPGY